MSGTKQVHLDNSFPTLLDFICLFGVIGTVAAVCAAKELAVCLFAVGFTLALFWVALIIWDEVTNFPSAGLPRPGLAKLKRKEYPSWFKQAMRTLWFLLLADVICIVVSAFFFRGAGLVTFQLIGGLVFAIGIILACLEAYHSLDEDEDKEEG